MIRPALPIALALFFAGCIAAPPAAYYTLSPISLQEGTSPQVSVGVSLDRFPEALDRSEFMVRTGPHRLAVAEQHRWAGPLKRQFVQTVSENLVRLTGSQAIVFAPWDERFEPAQRVSIALLQFDGAPGCPVTLRARWAISEADGSHLRIHSSQLCEVAGPDFPDLVTTQNRLIGQLAEEIAAALVAQ